MQFTACIRIQAPPQFALQSTSRAGKTNTEHEHMQRTTLRTTVIMCSETTIADDQGFQTTRPFNYQVCQCFDELLAALSKYTNKQPHARAFNELCTTCGPHYSCGTCPTKTTLACQTPPNNLELLARGLALGLPPTSPTH